MNSTSRTNPFKSKINIISISLTNQCNLKCRMCWKKKSKTVDNLDYKDFMIILNKIEKLSPAHIYLWGGEPLLHPKLTDIIKQIKRKKFICHLITNGVLLKNNTDMLLEAKLDRISISLDGVGNVHDKIRGIPGAYVKVIDGLSELLKKRNIRPLISINIVITEHNYLTLYETIERFLKFKINGLQLQFPVFFDVKTGQKTQSVLFDTFGLKTKSWQGFINSYQKINIKKLNSILNDIRKHFPSVGFYPTLEAGLNWFKDKGKTKPYCRMPWKRVNIEPDGNMVICPDYSDMIVGNLLENSFDELWESQIYRHFRKKLVDNNYLPLCKNCTYAYVKWHRA